MMIAGLCDVTEMKLEMEGSGTQFSANSMCGRGRALPFE